ncbi:transcription factor bHLH145-like [Rhodamnia argentea]|uniref:Transcription factor bHLH145-like n=1 Tax=Rhodamnia argentea TaxID=178133 RepID=A0A8B8Q6K9_9MYRT|nr:transcription factor bHLH145-like [Rhodamnia argentea]
MGEDFGAWFSRHHLSMRVPAFDPLSAPYALGHEYVISTGAVTGAKMVSNDAGCPLHAHKELPTSHIGQPDEAHGWFYCLPRFRQAFIPELNSSVLKDGSLVGPSVDFDVDSGPWKSSGCVERKFVVFDQSMGQTRIFYSSGIKSPNHCLNSLCVPHHIDEEVERRKSDVNFLSGPTIANFKDDHGDDVQSEMHEDTEELNALLYSDDDSDDSEEDEVDSTGHSPSMMTGQEREEYFGESGEVVASSAWPMRKRRLVDNPSSSTQYRYIENETEVDSNAGDGSSSFSGEVNSTCCNKRLCKERICETVSLLEKVLPGTKGKDATVVLDEAIRYLNSLKDEATALGFSTM